MPVSLGGFGSLIVDVTLRRSVSRRGTVSLGGFGSLRGDGNLSGCVSLRGSVSHRGTGSERQYYNSIAFHCGMTLKKNASALRSTLLQCTSLLHEIPTIENRWCQSQR